MFVITKNKVSNPYDQKHLQATNMYYTLFVYFYLMLVFHIFCTETTCNFLLQPSAGWVKFILVYFQALEYHRKVLFLKLSFHIFYILWMWSEVLQAFFFFLNLWLLYLWRKFLTLGFFFLIFWFYELRIIIVIGMETVECLRCFGLRVMIFNI